MKIRWTILLAGSLCASCRIDPGMAVEPMIQRPRLSVTTETAAHGTLQAETGFHWDPGHSLAVPGYWRVGLGPRTETYLGGDTYKWNFDTDLSSPGDLIMGVRHRILDEEADLPAFGIQMETKFPSADETKGFGTGVFDWKVGLIADKHFGDTLLSVMGQAGYLGETDGPGLDFELMLAASALQSLGGRWTGYVEGVSITSHEQNRDEGYVGAGVHYRLGGGTLLDLSVLGGFGDALEDTLIVFGYSRSVGRFYHLR